MNFKTHASMKYIALIGCLFIVFCGNAQTISPLLFTKGAELEYRTFSTKSKLAKIVYYEVTRITLTVTDVKDSSGVTYSYITKKGTGIEHPDANHYEKNM